MVLQALRIRMRESGNERKATEEECCGGFGA